MSEIQDKIARDASDRRFQVWKLRQAGMSQSAIATKLMLSPKVVSDDCAYLDDSEILWQRIRAEEPFPTTGDRGVDGLYEQVRSLSRAQARYGPSSKEFLKRSEQISWGLLKAGTLKAALPHGGEPERTIYNFTCNDVALFPTVQVTPFDAVGVDPDLLDELRTANRLVALPCHCGSTVWASIASSDVVPSLAWAPVDELDAGDEPSDAL